MTPLSMTPLDSLDLQKEQGLRKKLGIPDQAQRVLFLGETSHWDPNWLFTAERYYQLRIERILDAVIDQLQRQPRRVYAIESLFFLQIYWERRQDQRQHLRRLINTGQLRLTGTGITSPDTLLPSSESILRDFLLGQEWLRNHGMEAEPNVVYLPDGFGHSPAIPSMLRALGFEMAAVTRIDGMFFMGTDYRPQSAFPLPGSSAELLQKRHKTLDFIWRGPDGAEVICHWNAFTYFQGDMLAHRGIIRWMGVTFGIPWRTARHVARQIDSFTSELAALSVTPYLFCPLGCDFNGPIENLVGLLDRYNATRYPDTGTWVMSGALEDYLELVGCHRHRLPTLELDPNPYWMGFYASRPEIKRRCNRIAHKVRLTEQLTSVMTSTLERPDANAADASELRDELRSAWDLLVVSNHHDFITGTSPDSIWREEQRPWLMQAEAHADRALELASRGLPPQSSPWPAPPPRYRRQGPLWKIQTRHYEVTVSEAAGGCITSLRDQASGQEMIHEPANDLVAFNDSGGLWRMGHEFKGGTFAEISRGSTGAARVWASDKDGVLELRVESTLDGHPFTRWIWCSNESPIIRLRLSGSARRRRTVTCRFPTTLRAAELTMNIPGGIIRRPFQRHFNPTFWPIRSFAHLLDEERGSGIAVFLGGPASIALDDQGALQWIALRNTPWERAFGLLPVPAHPAAGADPDEHPLEYGIMITPPDFPATARLPRLARGALEDWPTPNSTGIARVTDALVATDHPEVMVNAVKRASRGSGMIVRLRYHGDGATQTRIHCPMGSISSAILCDARERDQQPLRVVGGNVLVPLEGALTSVRLCF